MKVKLLFFNTEAVTVEWEARISEHGDVVVVESVLGLLGHVLADREGC